MKAKNIAIQFGLDQEKFETFLKTSDYKFEVDDGYIVGMTLDNDADVKTIVEDFKKWKEQEIEKLREEEAQRHQKEEEQKKAQTEKEAALSQMLISSGFNFDGYTITKYSGYISGDGAVDVDRGTTGFFGDVTNVGESLMASLKTIREKAVVRLKEEAYALGCNAVIGVDFDYITLEPEVGGSMGGTVYLPYVFGVTANGNAVIIEKNKD